MDGVAGGLFPSLFFLLSGAAILSIYLLIYREFTYYLKFRPIFAASQSKVISQEYMKSGG